MNAALNKIAIQSENLAQAGVKHAFFTRLGGVSAGDYASLNGGVGSKDAADLVAQNRRIMAASLDLPAHCLLTPYQIHSPDCLIVDGPWSDRPRCDGLATATPGLALAVTGADCGMILFVDPKAQVVGAAHAGWKGAFGGVLEATLAAMEKLGASAGRIHATLGPTIRQESYEVGPEFFARFLAASPEYSVHFRSSARADHKMFDLPGFIGARLRLAGIAAFEDLALDTYGDEARFFSYRRATHRQQADYGRLVSAIALA